MGLVTKKSGRRTKATFVQARFAALAVIGVALAFAFTQGQATGASATAPQTTQQMTLIGASTIHSTPRGSGAVANPETDDRDDEGDGPGIKPGSSADVVVRPFATSSSSSSSKMPRHRANLPIPSKFAAARAAATARPNTSSSTFPPPEPNVPASLVVGFQSPGFAGFNGLSHVDQREANNGNQFSLEPPDQGLCAGNGFVVETVNDVIQVYDTRGNVLVGVEDMNSFFGLATQIDRTTHRRTVPERSPVLLRCSNATLVRHRANGRRRNQYRRDRPQLQPNRRQPDRRSDTTVHSVQIRCDG